MLYKFSIIISQEPGIRVGNFQLHLAPVCIVPICCFFSTNHISRLLFISIYRLYQWLDLSMRFVDLCEYEIQNYASHRIAFLYSAKCQFDCIIGLKMLSHWFESHREKSQVRTLDFTVFALFGFPPPHISSVLNRSD